MFDIDTCDTLPCLPEDDVAGTGDVSTPILLLNPVGARGNTPLFLADCGIVAVVPGSGLKHVMDTVRAQRHHHLCTRLQHTPHSITAPHFLELIHI